MSGTMRTDAQLLEAYCRGETAAFEEIYRRHVGLVCGVCLRRLGDPGEAEDATAATFMVLVRKARRLARGRKNLASWLHWCAVNVARSAARARARRAERERRAAEMQFKRETEDRPARGWGAVQPYLDAALAALPESQRAVVIMRHMQGRTLREVAEELKCPQSTAAKREQLALSKLRARLARHAPALGVSAVAAGLVASCSSEAVPAGLVARVMAMASGTEAGAGAGAGASVGVNSLAQAAIKAMAWAKVKTAALVLGAAAAVGAGGTVAAVHMAEPGETEILNPGILAMEDNSWLKLSPPGPEPSLRNFSGNCFGGGYLWHFGGAHKSWKYNDVMLYLPGANRWIQATEPEVPPEGSRDWTAMVTGGGTTYSLSPRGRPYTEHTYQQVCWQPERKSFFVVLRSSGTWEFDPAGRQWTHLVNRFENPEADPRGTWGNNHVFYDPGLAAPVMINEHGVFGFDHGARGWNRLHDRAEILKGSLHSTYVPQWKSHLLSRSSFEKTEPGYWLKFDARSGRIENFDAVPAELLGCQALDYDSRNGVVIALERVEISPGARGTSTVRPWALDPATGRFERLEAAEAAPLGRSSSLGRWAPFWYDPDHGVFLFWSSSSTPDGGEMWAYRYKRAPQGGSDDERE